MQLEERWGLYLMKDLVIDYFNTWQSIATRKEMYDLKHKDMLPLFSVLAEMTQKGMLTNQGAYYSRQW